jgi:cell division protease FtsH
MADALMKYETIDVEQIDQIMDGKVPDAPESWSDDDNDSSGNTNNVAPKDNPSTSPAS